MALASYLSPLRYEWSGEGIDISSTTKLALRNKLVQASAAVDTWCNGSLLPEKHDFRGGTITGEIHTFRGATPLLNEPGARRIFLRHTPLRTVSSIEIQYTPTYRIVIPSEQLFVSQQGFVEIVAINPTIIGYPPIGWMIGPYQPFSVTDYTYGWRFAATDDVLEAISPKLYMASHGNWLAGGAVAVEIDGVAVNPANYTINESDGTVNFATAPAPDTIVAASYVHTLPPAIEAATAIIATDLLGQARLSQRGMIGLQSLRVAEVAITQMSPGQRVTRNGITIPSGAASLLGNFVIGSAA